MPSNVVDYGTPEQPNLEAISTVAKSALDRYCIALPGLKFQEDFMLQHTPEKTTTARAVVDTFYNSTKVGDLYVILFAPGDGTGKEGEYKFAEDLQNTLLRERIIPVTRDLKSKAVDDWVLQQNISVPNEYLVPKRKGVLPRNKLEERVLIEAFLPLFSVNGEENFPYAVSLEQITVDNVNAPTRLVRGLEMGVSPKAFECATNLRLYGQPHGEPQIQLTCGYRRNGQRFGDPHATFYNPALAKDRPNLMQVAGFLSVESADNPLCKVLDRIATAPE